MSGKRYAIAFAALAISGAGCASVKPRASFPGIASDVETRTSMHAVWNDGGPASRDAQRQLDALLAKPLTADAAVQIALLSNRSLQATYEDLGIAEADLVQAGLLRNPAFSGAIEFGDAGNDSPRVDLNVAFDFLNLLFIPLNKRVASAQLDVSKAQVTSAVLDLAGRTRRAFVAAQAAQQTLELRRQVVDATTVSLDLARRLREAGNNRPLDVLNEQSLREESRVALARAELDLASRRERLNRLMGLWGPRTTWTIAGRLPEPTGEEVAGDALESTAIAKSLELKSQAGTFVVAAQRLGIARPLGILSDLEVGAAVEREGGIWFGGPSVALPIPIFSQGQPAVARAAAALRQAADRYFATAVDVRSVARQTWQRVGALRQQVDFYRATLLPLRANVLSQTQLQYNAMQIGAFQLLQARRDQIEAGRSYVALLGDYWSARGDLNLILDGRLPEAAMETNDDSTMAGLAGDTGASHD